MPQILIEAGSADLQPIMQSAQSVSANQRFTIERLPADRTHSLAYEPSTMSWLQAQEELAAGVVSSVRVIYASLALRWLLIYSPRFDGEGVPWWSLVGELQSQDYKEMFRLIRSIPGIAYVVASLEDTLDLEDGSIGPEGFPWDDERLIRAAVRDSIAASGSWTERRGSAG